MKNDNTVCPVCGRYHFEEPNTFEECPNCGWVDDLVQRNDPDYKSGFNRISVNEAREKFASGKKVFDK